MEGVWSRLEELSKRLSPEERGKLAEVFGLAAELDRKTDALHYLSLTCKFDDSINTIYELGWLTREFKDAVDKHTDVLEAEAILLSKEMSSYVSDKIKSATDNLRKSCKISV